MWLGWTLGYFVLLPEGASEGGGGWFNVAVCCGVIATPSALLLVIFVPKVNKGEETFLSPLVRQL